MAQSDLPPIRFKDLAHALLARVDTLLERWLPGGVREGHEYKCADMAGGRGRSMSVNMDSGVWSDFAFGDSGPDLISLYAAIHSLDMGKAARQVAHEEGLEDVAGIIPAHPTLGESFHESALKALGHAIHI